jgi:SAM-dependent methyltransferase
VVEDDAYPDYSPLFFQEIVPAPTGWTVEVGCGEGRVCRDLSARGHRILGVELAPTLVRQAAVAQPEGRFVRGDARRLPLPDAVADTVVSYCSLIDIAGMPQAVIEMARILRRDGRLCICVTHPIADAGDMAFGERSAPFALRHPYLGARATDFTFHRDRFELRLRGWTYSIEEYSRALEAAGLVIERIREVARPDAEGRPTRHVPTFLFLRARLV